MRIFAQETVAALLGLLSVHAAFAATAQGPDFLKNDKEARSTQLSDSARKKAHAVQPDLTPELAEKLGSRLREELLAADGACESRVIAALQRELEAANLPFFSAAEIGAALELLRESDAIDDLVLMPVLNSLLVWHKNPYSRQPADELEKQGDRNGGAETTDLKAMFAADASSCETDSYLAAYRWLREHDGRTFKRKRVKTAIASALKQGILGERRAKWLLGLFESKFENDGFTLARAIEQQKIAKNAALTADAAAERSDFAAGKAHDAHGLSRRLWLYHRYSGVQILMMAETFRKFKNRIGAVEADIDIHYHDGSVETRRLTPMEQYRMAAKMLHEAIAELGRDSSFFASDIPFEDIISSALETGDVAAHEVESVLTIDALWDPKLTPFQKAVAAIRPFVGTALVLVPPPFNIISAIAVVLADAFLKHEEPRSATDRGVSIF